MNSIETINLTHKFGDQTALDNVNLQVGEGTIYGFLGPNGAGKTTTLKLILGLLQKQQGEILVFGKPFAENRVETLRSIGSLIESPSLYGQLTAVENLKVFQKVYRCSEQRINDVLKLVDLSRTGKKKASQFSLGMKQRLSIAMALLHNPSLLILDEPTNGLDPNGILEIRKLLEDLTHNHGITILISSHLLFEIEKFVTHIGIINQGRLLFQGTLAELISKRQQNSLIVFETNNDSAATRIIGEFSASSLLEPGKIAIPLLEKEQVAAINHKLVQSNIEVYQITKIENDLEKIFFDVIGE